MKYIKKSIYSSFMGNGFRFISFKQLPQNEYNCNFLIKSSNINWITTIETNRIAKNHCAAVAATNISLFISNSFLNDNINKYSLFKLLYSDIGNGPVFSINRDIKKYFLSRNIFLKSEKVKNFNEFKSEIDKGHVVAFLLARGIVNWHWVIGVGYRQYIDGQSFIQIVTGWNNTTDRFFEVKGRRPWISAISYFI